MKKNLLAFLFFFFTSTIVFSQWDSLQNGVKVFPDVGGVFAFNTYQGLLYTGGDFSMAGRLNMNAVGEWNGINWQDTTGIGFHGRVYTLVQYQGNLYAGGYFDSINEKPAYCIAYWNGSSWSTPSGINITSPGYPNIQAFAIYHGYLYVGGSFDSIGGMAAKNIAKWNGINWSSAGKLNGGSFGGSVTSLAVYNGKLIAGGAFDSADGNFAEKIAIWNDTTWSPVGAAIMDTSITSLAVYNGALYAGGYSINKTGPWYSTLHKWDGNNWSLLISGPRWKYDTYIFALTVYDSLLCIGGEFDSIGNTSANCIAYWDGNNWGKFGLGVPYMSPGGGTVYSFGVYNSALYAGGIFDSAGGILVNNIAKWSGSPVGINEIENKTSSVKVYPNPSSGKFTFGLPKTNSIVAIEVYNMLGEKVHSESLSSVITQIDLSTNPDGIYLYRIVSKDETPIAEGKLIIQ